MNKKLLSFFAVLFAFVTAHATDYFVAELSGTTLTFKKTTTPPDETTSWDATNTGNTDPGWLNSTVTSIVIEPSFYEARPTSCHAWFKNFTTISGISGFAYLNTSLVTDTGYMFYGCNGLTLLDLSSCDFTHLTQVEGMFTECRNLHTIFVAEGLGDFSYLGNSQWPFGYNYALTGGAGCYYQDRFPEAACARIDDGRSGMAYFSAAITLANTSDNTSTISNYDEKKVKATLADRTLYKDNSWNTICLPFDVDLTETNSPLYGATVKELDTEAGTYDHVTGFENGTLYLNFKDVTSTMTAGTPYIIKWPNGDDIVNPAFLPVNIDNTTNDVTSNDGKVTFTGTYSPVSITSEGDNTKLYLSASNKLYYPNGNMTIGCQRAYFQLNGITAGDVATSRIVLNFDGESTDIVEVEENASHQTLHSSLSGWYTLDGRKLNAEPTEKGLYLKQGRKVYVGVKR